ncbi:MAG: xylulokinase [Verrucomicrobiales bacterium]|nr:xylulokinase [Verrucomicrobiales bacterium]
MLFIGIDSGTQSTKSIVLDLESGGILAEAQGKYDLIPGLPPGHLEQDPRVWSAAVRTTVARCLDAIGDRRGEVRGIGVSGQQHGLVVLDEADEVIRPAKLWCDTSTAAQCEQFAAAFGGQAGLIARAGNAILPGYTIPKLLWLKQNEPDHFDRVRTVLLPHDYLNFWLTGIKRMEYGDASGSGILDVRTRQWDRELIDFVDPRVIDTLPPLGSSNAVHGTLRPDLAAEWGFSSEVIVSAGGGDNMMGAIGTGNIRPGIITASFGTSGTLYGCAASPVIDPEGEIAAFCDSTDRWLPLVCTMNVTVVTEQVRGWFGWDLPEMERQIASAPPGAGGLTFLPYLNGERTPNLPGGSGVLHGLNGTNASPAQIARAAMEGATLGLAYGLRRFDALGLSATEIRLTGGGSKSAVWRQIAADVFGVPVVGLATAEGASLGGAIQAAHAAGQGSYETLCDRLVALEDATRCEPDAGHAALYREQLDRQSALTAHLKAGGYL